MFALPAGIITSGFRNEQIRRHPSAGSLDETPCDEEVKDLLRGVHQRMEAMEWRMQAMQADLAAIRAER